jgi:hypothetical protein
MRLLLAGWGLEELALEEIEFFFDFFEGLGAEAFLFWDVVVQFFADFGFFEPGPELFFFLRAGVGLLEGEPLAFEVEAVGVKFGATKAGDIGAELAKAAPTGLGVGLGSYESLGGGGVLEAKPAGEFVGEVAGEGLLVRAKGLVEGAEEVEGILADEPIAVAALFPFSEIRRGKGARGKIGGEEGLDFREGVEPLENGLAGLAVAEADVELFAQMMWQTGDFARASVCGMGSGDCGVHNECGFGADGLGVLVVHSLPFSFIF